MIGESGVKKRIFGLAILFLLLVPLSTFAEIKLDRTRSGGIQYQSIYQWRLGYYLVGVAEAKHFVFQGVSRKSLKLKLEGKWGAYQDQIISIDYSVNDGLPKLLQEAPRFYLGNNCRELTLYLNEEGIEKIEALQADDELIFLISTNKGESTQIEISPEILVEWLAVYNPNL